MASSRPTKRLRADPDVHTRHDLGSVYFFGKGGPQAAMFQHADADHEFYVSRQTNKGRSFASYRDAEAFLSEYEKIPPPGGQRAIFSRSFGGSADSTSTSSLRSPSDATTMPEHGSTSPSFIALRHSTRCWWHQESPPSTLPTGSC
jgi:hypothetical protein